MLGGLEGKARAERAELIEWLLDHGVTVEEIRGSFTPMLLASRRLIGDDGSYVSAREISETTGVDLELLQRIQRAIGLARVDDPDAVVHMRADGVAAAHAQRFLEVGLDPDHLVQVVRVLAEGLSHAAEVMRYTALAAILEPGLTELDIAKRSYELVSRIAPLLGPWIEDMLFMHLRHQMETEAVNASERAAGAPLPERATWPWLSPIWSASPASVRWCHPRSWCSSPNGWPTSPETWRSRRCDSSRRSATR
ncbi:pH-sensitive adenylate cyclase [Mycobacterium xenopi 4042]|uniref:pH-sensitive adenylate cyclase n=1 Tax=Mycobacterium xenopi 4042 TaxID=1299334 RepID=X8E0G6_MYCXE|nr:pH-sensitive adenylate cyclase [Mycobacterium xenopi 4042]